MEMRIPAMHLNKNGYEVKKAGFTSIATIQGD
jgi:hypothetical protein